MKPIKLLLSMLLFWMVIQNAHAQHFPVYQPYEDYIVSLPENSLPSETTYKQYSGLIDYKQSGDDLRAAPPGEPGDGYAQKMPLNHAHWLMAIVALLVYIIYRKLCQLRMNDANGNSTSAVPEANNAAQATSRRRRNNKTPYNTVSSVVIFFSIIAALLLCCTPAFAAVPVANNANYYSVPRTGTNIQRNYNVTVLNNASFDCLPADITIAITTAPVNGTVVNANLSSGGSKVIQYRADVSSMYVLDSLKYTITCNSETSAIATAYLHPGNRPDNISANACAIPAVPFAWVFGTKARSGNIKCTAVDTWLAGDWDNSGLPEIVTTGGRGAIGSSFDSLVVFRDGNLADATVFNLKGLAGITTGFYRYGMYSARQLMSRYSNGKGAYVAINGDGYIYAYEYDTPGNVPALAWKYKSDQPWANTSATAGTYTKFQYTANNLGVTDFDGDGAYEIYTGHKVFSLDGLIYLTGLPDTDYSHWRYNDPLYNNCGYSVQNGSIDRLSDLTNISTGAHAALRDADDGQLSMSIAIDLDYDGLPELVCGGKAYKVTNNSGTWSMTLYKSAPEINTGVITTIGTLPIRNDGRTTIADFNNDGHPDIFVDYVSYHTSTGAGNQYWACYGWDVHNNAILFADTIQAQVSSVCLLADIDGDGKVEIAHTKFTGLTIPPHNSPYNVVGQDAHVRGYKTPATWGASSRLTRKWWERINENATRTGMTAFDFNNDGKMEIIYRDMENLRIMNAETNGSITNLLITPSGSGTTNEMPIVVDVDGDGAAEILCVGGPAYNNSTGEMFIYASGSTSPWAPARKVWNQYAYNPTFVNEDLSIPVHAFNPSEKFKQINGSTKQPFNNFYQQVSSFSPSGETLNLGANLLFNPANKPKMDFNPGIGTMTITANILNNGDIPFTGQIKLAMYAYKSGTGYTLLGSYTYGNASSSLAVNSSVNLSYTITGFMSLLPAGFEQFYLFINSNDVAPAAPTYPATMIECEYGDNLTGRLSFTELSRVICEGKTEILKLPDTYSYKWFTSATGGVALTTETGHDNWYSLTKNSDERTLLFVENYPVGNLSGQPVSPFRDTLFIYRTPDSLIWTGAYNSDWHLAENWSKPAGVIDTYPMANIPRECTNILIPDALTRYPDLQAGTSGTTYAIYPGAACNRITINHGGEVKQPDSLHYVRAYVDVTFNSNRWYMWSPPLKDLYPGDIYINDKNPYLDPVYVYTKLFAKANPQTGYLAADWTGNFITPVIPITAGDGMRVWIDDHQPATVHDPYDFYFPKGDLQHHIYGADNQGIWATFNVPGRANNGRFIFDGLPNTSAKNFTIATPGSSGSGVPANGLWLVGNPFMAHIDFDKFYAANSTKIKNQFRIMTANGSYEYYNTGASTLTQYIAPMQSFIVEAQSAFTGLTLNANMTVNHTGTDRKLRTAAEAVEPVPVMSIALADPTDQRQLLSRIFIVADPTASNALDEADLRLMANVYNNPADEPTVLFSKSVEESPSLLSVNYLDANNLKDVDIPLGLRGVKKGQKLCLLVQGQTYLADGYDLNLLDKLTNTRYNLRGTTWFYFDNPTAAEQLDDRFVIEIGLRSGNGIEDIPAIKAKTVVSKSYFDLIGRPVPNVIAKGILLRKSVYDDGTIGFEKVYIK